MYTQTEHFREYKSDIFPLAPRRLLVSVWLHQQKIKNKAMPASTTPSFSSQLQSPREEGITVTHQPPSVLNHPMCISQRKMKNNLRQVDLSTVHLFPKGCIYICKFYCTENIQNVHNYRYSIPQSCPGITKHSCSALEKLCSLFIIIILNTFFNLYL